ncbi:hypothetical protein FK178_03410 [Antarcticibacterium arcticum]|uniref:STAS/SEC14 domain-containing protein n=1 Tax=Antarcticibacterium arcticum TaxID=2585771 RepID=A0A5B8YFW6_9FLAO|nr:hypothetical protein [Antarcticibacterium arcticum]QED36815.1 hypothetical protein FK178_03410 [Antarcticibacterium arcticum]
MEEILRTIELEFTTLEFHENFVISRVREGVIISKKQVHDLVEVCSDIYKGKKFVYISKRVNNYNVDPTIYLNIKHVKNLAGIAIVSTKASSINMANFEQVFSKVPFSVFMEMEDALEWVKDILAK